MSRVEELIALCQAGDADAKETMIAENSGLIWSVTRRFLGRGAEADDMYQLACLGFLKAVDGFDLEFGTQFSTYAVPMIIGEIRRYLRDNNAIRISRSVRDLAYRALGAREELMGDNQNEPTPAQIAEKIGESREAVVRAMEAIIEPMSLYEPIYSENGDSLYVIDQLADTNSSDEMWLENIALAEALDRLGERERKIIDMRFYKNKTQMEIADEIGADCYTLDAASAAREAVRLIREMRA